MSETPAFTAATADYLQRFLSAPERPEGTMGFDELGGFLFALACVPEVIPPTEWLPVVFRDGEANYGSDGAEPSPPGCLSDVAEPENLVCFPGLPLLSTSDAKRAGSPGARSFWLPLPVDENVARAIENAADRRVLLVFERPTVKRRSFEFLDGTGAAPKRLTMRVREARNVTLVIADEDRVIYARSFR